MVSSMRTARIVAALFIVALVADLISVALYSPVLDATDYLAEVVAKDSQFIVAMLFEFIAGIAIILIPVALFPIIRPHSERSALGYVLFRFLEGVIFIYIIINLLSLIDLGNNYVESGVAEAQYIQTLGDSIRAVDDWATLIYIVVFTLGAFTFYQILFRSKLVPRFISVWGFVAAAILLTGALLSIFDIVDTSTIMMVCGPPIALNEVTLSVWLIFKGFNQSEIGAVSVD
jgi:hypothetical protein